MPAFVRKQLINANHNNASLGNMNPPTQRKEPDSFYLSGSFRINSSYLNQVVTILAISGSGRLCLNNFLTHAERHPVCWMYILEFSVLRILFSGQC